MAFTLRSTTAVVVKDYDYEGSDSPKPLKADLDYIGSSARYGEVTQVGTGVTDYSAGDIVVYNTSAGILTKMDGEEVRLIDETDIYYHLT